PRPHRQRTQIRKTQFEHFWCQTEQPAFYRDIAKAEQGQKYAACARTCQPCSFGNFRKSLSRCFGAKTAQYGQTTRKRANVAIARLGRLVVFGRSDEHTSELQ